LAARRRRDKPNVSSACSSLKRPSANCCSSCRRADVVPAPPPPHGGELAQPSAAPIEPDSRVFSRPSGAVRAHRLEIHSLMFTAPQSSGPQPLWHARCPWRIPTHSGVWLSLTAEPLLRRWLPHDRQRGPKSPRHDAIGVSTSRAPSVGRAAGPSGRCRVSAFAPAARRRDMGS